MTENQKTIAIRGRWVLSPEDGVLADRWVICEGGAITAIASDRPSNADIVIDRPELLVVPGLHNLHNHGISALLFRGIIEDRPTASWASDTVYGLIMPLQGLAMEVLDPAEMRAVTALGLLGLIKSGTTTLMDMFRNDQAVTFDVADEMGLRLYGMPYLFSTGELGIGGDGKPSYAATDATSADLARCLALIDEHDGRADGRIRVGFGPHGGDTCGPDLLREIRKAANERGSKITIHLSQSQTEDGVTRALYGKSPAEYLDHVGLLGPDLFTAHCIYATDDDLALLRKTDSTIVNCPMTFARGAVAAVWQRFNDHGVRTAIGTDGYEMDIIAELRAAAVISKLHTGLSEKTTADQLIRAATVDSANALQRPDLGRIAAGARADLVVVDMNKAHMQPVSDPLRTLVWHATGADVAAVVIDGRLVVSEGQHQMVDEAAILRDGGAAVRKVWAHGVEAGIVRPEEVA